MKREPITRCQICFRKLVTEFFEVEGDAGRKSLCEECMTTFNAIGIRYEREEKGRWVKSQKK